MNTRFKVVHFNIINMMTFGNRRTDISASYFKCLFVILYCNEQYLSIMDFLRGQYVIYGPLRIMIILTETEVRGEYNRKRSIYNILPE